MAFGGRTSPMNRRARTLRRRRAVFSFGAAAVALAVACPLVADALTDTDAPKVTVDPGIRVSFGPQTLSADTHVMGGQIVLEWSEIEPSNGTFCWSNPRVTKAGCGTAKSNAGQGLDAQLAYYQRIGKGVTVQV